MLLTAFFRIFVFIYYFTPAIELLETYKAHGQLNMMLRELQDFDQYGYEISWIQC